VASVNGRRGRSAGDRAAAERRQDPSDPLYARAKEKTVTAVFGGVLSSEFIEVFLRQNRLKDSLFLNEVENLYNRLKKVELTVTGTRPLKEAQVSLGGVAADEIDPVSFESKLQKDLFIVGEAIDYTGGCGGYNIHWCAATARGVADRIGEL
jgi:predicted flavoprotein YhiN